jgi:hypothetical protein
MEAQGNPDLWRCAKQAALQAASPLLFEKIRSYSSLLTTLSKPTILICMFQGF